MTPGVKLTLNAGGSYLVNTPVFFDRTDKYRSYELDLNGAKRSSDQGCQRRRRSTVTPRRSGVFREHVAVRVDTGTNVVTVNDSTRASGPSVGNLMPLIIRNGTVAGSGNNRALLFGNRGGNRLERLVLSGARALVSWYDYSDVCVLEECHNRRDTEVTRLALIIQLDNGDRLEIRNPKADGGMMVADLRYCRGAEITAQ